MSFEEEFDDIVKRKAEEAKFSFRESDWEKARKMIDQERMAAFNSASRVNYWYVSAFVLLSSMAVLYFALPETVQLAQADEVVYTSDAATKGSNAGVAHTRSTLPNGVLNPVVSKEVIAAKVEVAKTEFAKNSGLKSAPPSSHNSQSFGAGTIPEMEVNLVPATEEHVSNPESFINEGKQEETFVSSNDLQKFSLNKREIRLNQIAFDEDLQVRTVFLKRYEEEDYVPKSKSTRHALDVVLGLNYFGGWDNKGSVTAKGLNGYAGVSYMYFLNKKLNLNLGAELYNISNMDQEFYSATSKNYGFGSSQTQTVLTCQSMLFLSFPLRVYYAADDRHLIGVGVHAGTLLMASNAIETSDLSDGVKQNVNTVSSKGVYQGMNTTNILLSASIHKTIGDRIALQLELYYGLSDLFTDTPSNGYQQNSNGIRVGMNYRIFRN